MKGASGRTQVVLFVVVLSLPAFAAEDPVVVPLWPGAAPGDYGSIGPERVRAPEESPTRDAKWITGVTRPTVTVFRPAPEKNTGVAIIVCPGGGYWNLAWDLEGEEVAAWLNSIGVTGVVLKYRVPRRPGQIERFPAPGPLLDAQRALSLVRFHSRAWGIVPDHIGIVGFSAGGHLAIRSATAFDHRGYKRIDAIDDVSCRPDFAIAVYPGYLIPQQPEGPTLDLAPDLVIPPRMPPVFLVHASDDTVSSARHSAAMYLALKQAQVPAELHLYAQGGHGFGVRPGPLPCTRWTDRCESWLQSLKFLPRPTPDHSPIAPRPGRP